SVRAGGNAAALPCGAKRGERLAREFQSAFRRAGAVLVVDGELLVGVQAVARFAQDVFPEFGGAIEVAFAFGQPRQFAPSGAVGFLRQARGEGTLVEPAGGILRAAALLEARKAVEFERVAVSRVRVRDERQNPRRERRQAAQVHLIVAEDLGERLRASAAQVGK